MPSDAFIGILTGLGEAHRTRQKNIFDQEVDRRSKYEKLLQTASTDPSNRPAAQAQLANLYTELIGTPHEKKMPKDFERRVMDTLTSVEGEMDLTQGGPAPQAQGGLKGQDAAPGRAPNDAQGRVPSRFGHEEKFAEAMRLLNAQLQARQGSEIETERQKIAMQPDEAFPFGAESGLATRSGKVIREPELKPVKPPGQPNLEAIEITLPGQAGPVPAMRNLDPDNPETVGKIFVRTPQGLQDVTAQARLYQKPTPPPFIIRNEAAVTAAAAELPKEWRNVVTRAMPSNSSQATRLARLNEAAGYIDAGDTEGLKSRVRQLAIEGENVGTQMQVEGRADALVAMKNGLQALADMRKAGIDTNILTGTWEDVLRKLGTTSHPKRVEFASRMQRALSAYTLAMSGVQFSEAEAKRYYQLFPNASNTLLVNETLAKSLIQSMGAEDKRFWEQKLGPDGAKLVGATADTGGGGEQRVRMPSGEVLIYDASGKYLRTEKQ